MGGGWGWGGSFPGHALLRGSPGAEDSSQDERREPGRPGELSSSSLSQKPKTTGGRKLRRGPKGDSTGKEGVKVGGEGHAPHQDGPQCG